jgi:CDP-glucose 4,6-dehydratase
VEGLGVRLFDDIYRGRRVPITGHTGFKGSWLSLWLMQLGADISGISRDPHPDANHWDLLKLDAADHQVDTRDLAGIHVLIRAARPEVLLHLAARPLVRDSLPRTDRDLVHQPDGNGARP